MKVAIVGAWLNEIDQRLTVLKEAREIQKKLIVFTLSTTSKSDPQGRPYLTPLRETATEFISGVVVRSLDQGAIVAQALVGRADLVFVDAEAKRGLDTEVSPDLWKNLGLSFPPCLRRVPPFSLVEVCRSLLDPAVFRLFKPNDLTVESVWHFLDMKVCGPQEIGIFGAGNIGFKLALKLVEAGHRVGLHRRDENKGRLLVQALETAKPPLSSGEAYFAPDPLILAQTCRVLIGTSDGIPVITARMIELVGEHAIILDVGKGTVSPKAIRISLERGLDITRTDITSGLQGFLASHHRQVEILNHEFGRNEVRQGLVLISGGYLGHLGDVIVDHFRAPRHVIGLADGRGDLIRDLQPEHRDLLAQAHAYILELSERGRA